MLSGPQIDLRDESGTTMVELLVGMAMGMIVLVGLTMTLIVVLHGNARVDARIEATDNARIAVTRIIEELHSACISPKVAPVQAGSNVNRLIFWHSAGQQGDSVAPVPVKSEITYYPTEDVLRQKDLRQTGGTSPKWVFEEGPGQERTILTHVAPAGADGGVFTYFKYEGGGPVELELQPTESLSSLGAAGVILVQVALTASPRSTPVADAGADATVQNSAALALTPPSSLPGTKAMPCQ